MGLIALSGPVVTLIGGLLAIWAVKIISDYVKLRQFPGPSWTGVSNWPHSLALLRYNCHQWYAEVNDKYGPIARVAPQILITSDPDVWIHVNNKPGYKRSDWYYHAARIEYRKDNVFTQTDTVKHERRRKQMAPGFSGRENFELEGVIDERVQELLKLIREKYISFDDHTVPVDLAKKSQYFTLDVISSVGLGKAFGMLKSDQDVDNYLSALKEGLCIGNNALAMGISWITQAPLIGKYVAASPKDKNGFGKMMSASFRTVDARAASTTDKRSDMLASFIRHGISGEELRSEALEQILAGSDTTSGAITGTLMHIMTNPRVYHELQREIDNAVNNGLAPTDSIIASAQAKKLPYLQAVIREALRVWPPVANIFSRDVPPEGDTVTVDGESVNLPGGACIGYSAYSMHHSKKIYGSDSKVFRPERWFESDPAKLALMIRTNELIFGHGKYRCLGKPVADIEIGKLIFEIFRNFDLSLINPTRPWEVENYLGLFAISDMWTRVTERSAHYA